MGVFVLPGRQLKIVNLGKMRRIKCGFDQYVNRYERKNILFVKNRHCTGIGKFGKNTLKQL